MESNPQYALIRAISTGDVELALQLLDSDHINLDERTIDGNSALMHVAAKGYNKIINKLLEKKALVNSKNKKGETALIIAANTGQLSAAITLIENGVDINIQDDNGKSAIIHALENGYIDIAIMLLSTNKVTPEALDQALLIAVKKNQAAIVDKLLTLNANVNSKDNNRSNYTPLMIAILDKRYEIAYKLLTAKNIDIDVTNGHGENVLMLSANVGNLEFVNAILAKRVDVNKANSHGNTALMGAAIYGKTEIIETLLKHGAQIDLANNNQETALMFALKKGHTKAFRLLFEKTSDDDRLMAFNWAINNLSSTKPNIIEYIIQYTKDEKNKNKIIRAEETLLDKQKSTSPPYKLLLNWLLKTPRAIVTSNIEAAEKYLQEINSKKDNAAEPMRQFEKERRSVSQADILKMLTQQELTVKLRKQEQPPLDILRAPAVVPVPSTPEPLPTENGISQDKSQDNAPIVDR